MEGTSKSLRVVYGDFTLGVHGEGFDYIFSYAQGGLESLVKNGYEWLYRCPKPTFWRALTDNDRGSKFHIKSGSWLAADMFIDCKDVEVITDGVSQGKPCAPENNKYGGDVFADEVTVAKWKRMRILLKLQHFNQNLWGKREYFTVAHYPLNPRIFKIGISWMFYD